VTCFWAFWIEDVVLAWIDFALSKACFLFKPIFF
jgi:hypothetical protein